MNDYQARVKKNHETVNCIARFDSHNSFAELIETNRKVFEGLRVIYSTNNISSEFGLVPLQGIEKECRIASKFFGGSGLLFYSDQIYKDTIEKGKINIPLDYSLTFDSNVAEVFRIYERGGVIQSKETLFELINFIHQYNFNFDYTFFIIENLKYLMDPQNIRPYNTIVALKRFDFLNYELFKENPDEPKFDISKEKASKKAIETIYTFNRSSAVQDLLSRRTAIYVILLKSILLNWELPNNEHENLNKLIRFCLAKIGKFPKIELYFAWKYLKYGKNFNFFSSIMQPNAKTIKSAKSMSWDLYSLRLQETLSTGKSRGNFFIPFFSSYDKKFFELSKACPVRSMVIDDEYEMVNTIFEDEIEFQKDLSDSMDSEITFQLNNHEERAKRLKMDFGLIPLSNLATQLESKVTKYMH